MLYGMSLEAHAPFTPFRELRLCFSMLFPLISEKMTSSNTFT